VKRARPGPAFLFISALVGGCTCPAKEPQAKPAKADTAMMNPMSSSRATQNFQAAELVFVGRPVEILKSPGIWSGTFASYQAIRYHVTRPLKGDVKINQEVTVMHPLVQGSALADTAHAQLSPTWFSIGRELIVFAKRKGERLICLSETDGVAVPSDVLTELSGFQPPA